MPLTLIATPIGNPKDISLRSYKYLQQAEHIIGEEPKACRKILTDLEISPRDKNLYFLNEHTTAGELNELMSICRNENVYLVSDCGTPAFCDPGADLVRLCHQNKIPVEVCPGASSLMTFMSLIGERWDRFSFLGFPPRDKTERMAFYKNLKNYEHPIFFLEAPYRLKSTLEALDEVLGPSKFHFGSNLTAQNEEYYYGDAKYILKKVSQFKAPFIIGFDPKK